MSADGTAAPAPVSGSILTTGLPEPAAPPAPDSAEAAIKAVEDGPPEWAPAKYWDPEKKDVRREDLGKAYMNLEKLLGREKVPVPTSDDDQEGWDRWYAASGRPSDPEEYEFKRPEKMPDGLDYDEDAEKEFRQWAHINGYSKKQAANTYEKYVAYQIQRHAAWATAQGQAKAQVEADLRREHGAQYEGFVSNARTAIATYTDPDFRAWLDQSGLGNDPRMIRAFGRIGKEMGGVTKLKGTAQPETQPADIEKAIADFRTTHSEALFKRDHPDHAVRLKEYNRLFEMLYPETGVR